MPCSVSCSNDSWRCATTDLSIRQRLRLGPIKMRPRARAKSIRAEFGHRDYERAIAGAEDGLAQHPMTPDERNQLMAYKFGQFVWFEVLAPDVEASKRFYTEVLGWSTREMDMGAGGKYLMLTKEDKPQCGVLPLEQGKTPMWNGYLSVQDVDAVAKAAQSHGGQIAVDAHDVPNIGRWCVIVDPQGGMLSPFRGVESDDNGSTTFHWMELWAPNPKQVVAFYQKSFGFAADTMPMPSGAEPYQMLKAGETPVAGLVASDQKQAVWIPYIQVADTDATLKRATARGASVLSEARDIPNVGRFCVISDPQGARVAFITPVAPPQ